MNQRDCATRKTALAARLLGRVDRRERGEYATVAKANQAALSVVKANQAALSIAISSILEVWRRSLHIAF